MEAPTGWRATVLAREIRMLFRLFLTFRKIFIHMIRLQW